MQEFDLEYEEIGAALGGGWDMTLWGVAFEDFLGRRFEGHNFVDEYLRRRGWNESAPAKSYMRGLRDSTMTLYEASAIVPGQSFLARDLIRGGEPALISERTATRTLKEWDRIAARVVMHHKRVLAGGVLPFSFEGSERLMANLEDAIIQSSPHGRSASSAENPPIAGAGFRGHYMNAFRLARRYADGTRGAGAHRHGGRRRYRHLSRSRDGRCGRCRRNQRRSRAAGEFRRASTNAMSGSGVRVKRQ
jgi:hypothetical protein